MRDCSFIVRIMIVNFSITEVSKNDKLWELDIFSQEERSSNIKKSKYSTYQNDMIHVCEERELLNRKCGRKKPCYDRSDRAYSSDATDFWYYLTPLEVMSHEPHRRDEEEYLSRECHDRRPDEWIVWNDEDIAYDIEECDDGIHIHHRLLSAMSDEDIGREWRDKVHEKYPYHDLHHIHTCISMYDGRHEFLSRDEPDDLIPREKEKCRYPYTEKEQEWKSMTCEGVGFCMFFFFYRCCQDWEERIQEHCPIHHPDFDDLHRESIECDDAICDCSWFHDREEDGVYLKKYHIQKKCQSVGKGGDEDMSHIGHIPTKSHCMPPICIPPGECCHEDITSETCTHDEDEFFCMSDRREDTREYEDHTECEELASCIRDEGKLSFEYWLEITHERAIDKSEESKKWRNTDTHHRLWTVVSLEKISDPKWEKYDTESWERAKCEDIGCDLFDHLRVVLMRWELTDGDRIESEIGDHGKYREIVIYLRIESISCYIEISREDLDHGDGDESGEDFACYLGNGVGVDFLGGHGQSVVKSPNVSKMEKKSLKVRDFY